MASIFRCKGRLIVRVNREECHMMDRRRVHAMNLESPKRIAYVRESKLCPIEALSSHVPIGGVHLSLSPSCMKPCFTLKECLCSTACGWMASSCRMA